jgi:NADH-quinone oxidoreductase subunit N
MTPIYAPLTIDYRDFFFVSPEIILMFWGLVVLLVDLALARRLSVIARQRVVGLLAMAGVGLALIAALIVFLVPTTIFGNPELAESYVDNNTIKYFLNDDPSLFFGTLAGDVQSSVFNILYVVLLGLILWMSTAWKFTEEWGEYLALMFWATVGMMLLTAAEELVTLFVTLETMTICLYLSTALEKTKRRSAEGAFKYFVYGSVSSALFLFGLSIVYGLAGTTQFGAIRSVLSSGSGAGGLIDNVAGAAAILLMLVGFGFKVAAVPFHQWAPEAYEGAPAPVTAWIATGSKLASFVAFMKVFTHALLPWSSPTTSIMGPGWIAVVAIISALTMTYGNFAALAQRNLKRMLAYSSIAHAGYILVGVAAISVSVHNSKAAAAVLYYLVVYAAANVGAFAVAAWLARDKDSDNIDDLNGVGYQEPLLATCILILMLSLIGIPPLAGFFGKMYVFMEALDQRNTSQPVTLIWLVALGLFNSVVSAFYYVRVLKAMFLRNPGPKRLAPPDSSIWMPIAIGTAVVVYLGIWPETFMTLMQGSAVAMLTEPIKPQGKVTEFTTPPPEKRQPTNPVPPIDPKVYAERMKRASAQTKGGGPTGAVPKKAATPSKKAAAPGKSAP